MQECRKEFPDANEKKLSACETAINKDLAVLRMILYRGHAMEKLAAAPSFPSPLQGAMERTGTITPEPFNAMLAECRDDEVWVKTMILMAYTWGYRLNEFAKDARHSSESERPDRVPSVALYKEQEAASNPDLR